MIQRIVASSHTKSTEYASQPQNHERLCGIEKSTLAIGRIDKRSFNRPHWHEQTNLSFLRFVSARCDTSVEDLAHTSHVKATVYRPIHDSVASWLTSRLLSTRVRHFAFVGKVCCQGDTKLYCFAAQNN